MSDGLFSPLNFSSANRYLFGNGKYGEPAWGTKEFSLQIRNRKMRVPSSVLRRVAFGQNEHVWVLIGKRVSKSVADN